MQKTDIEYNLLQALNVRGDYDQCVHLSFDLLSLPPVNEGGATIFLFSFIDWTPSMKKQINMYGFQQVSSKALTLPKKSTLYDEVHQ